MAKKIHHIALIAAILFSLTVICLLWRDQSARMGTAAGPESVSAPEIPLRIDGFSLANYKAGKLAARIRADVVSVMPQKMFIFRLRSINELYMKNVVIDAYFHQEVRGKGGMTGDVFSAELVQGGINNKSLGRISQVRMDNVEASLYVNDHPISKIEAKKGEANPKEKGIVFSRATITHLKSGRTISSSRILWNESEKRFRIPGEYQAETDHGRVRGRAIAVSPDFSLEKLPEI
jgi:hypothetical protein